MRAASLRQQSWMHWKSALADGTVPGTVFLAPADAERAARAAGRLLARRDRPLSRANVARGLEIALLHFAAGLSMQEVAERVGVAPSTVHAAARRSIPIPSHPLALPPRVRSGDDSTLIVRAADVTRHERSG